MNSERLRRLARDRLLTVFTQIVERALISGRVRPDLVPSDLPMIFGLIGPFARITNGVRDDLWRRCATLVIDGLITHDSNRAHIVPAPPSTAELERISESRPNTLD